MTDTGRAGKTEPVSAVLFDYGEVISQPIGPEARARLERLSGAAPAEFWTAYWAGRRDYDLGCTATGFWDGVGKRLGREWPPALRQQMWAVDVAGWLQTRPETVELVTRLHGGGVRLALLSNAPHDVAGALRASPLLEPFEAVFFSCDLGLAKPDPAVYTRVLDALGLSPEETLFVDDRAENVHSARAVGVTGHHYTGPGELASVLARYGLL